MVTRRVLAAGGFTGLVALLTGLIVRGLNADVSIERVFLTATSSCVAAMVGALFMVWCQENEA